MDIVKIIGIGILGMISGALVKESKPSLAIGINIATVSLIFVYIMSKIGYVIDAVDTISSHIDIERKQLDIIMKIIGISYLTSFGSEVTKDAGFSAIASKIELAGKLIIVAYSIPILVSLLNLLINILK